MSNKLHVGIEANQGDDAVRPTLYNLAEGLLDSPAHLAVYDEAKWNLIGHPENDARSEGYMPWLTRLDDQGRLRAYTLDVFSGVSAETNSLLVVRKDRWTSPDDPMTWLAMQTSLETGETTERMVLSAKVDMARQLRLVLASIAVNRQPHWDEYGQRKHVFRSESKHEQRRITATLDRDWRASRMELREGPYDKPITFEDIEALESMIIAIQQLRRTEYERVIAGELAARGYTDTALAA